MSILTERKKEIPRYLREGKSVMNIGRLLEVPVTGVSRSISSIKRKARDIEEDIAFMREIGYISFDRGGMRFMSATGTQRLLAGADDLPSTRFA